MSLSELNECFEMGERTTATRFWREKTLLSIEMRTGYTMHMNRIPLVELVS